MEEEKRSGSRYPEKQAKSRQKKIMKKADIPKVRDTQEKRGSREEKKEQEAKIIQRNSRRQDNMESQKEETAQQKQGLSWQEKLRLRKKKKLHRVYQVIGIMFGCAYIGTAVYFGFHFYQDTVIYGIDCSQKTAMEVKEEVAARLQEYTLTLEERGGETETISAEDIGLKYVDNNSIDQLMKSQHSWIWPVKILLNRKNDVSVAFTYSREKTEQALDQLQCFDEKQCIAPEDAYIGEAPQGYQVVAEEMGNMLDRKKAFAVIEEALDRGITEISLEEEDCYQKPEIYQDDKQMNADVSAMNELLKADLVFDFGDRTEEVNPALMRNWIVKLKDGSFVIDDAKVEQYVAELADKYDTFGGQRSFYTSYGTWVSLEGGDYGWSIDRDATTLELLKAINEGRQGSITPVYLYEGTCRDENDIGYTYVEICICNQRMFCYKDGNLIADTPVVTGNPNKGNGTPSGGVWAIDAKMRNTVLVGEGYRAPVDYWMPFNGNVGIHDLKQRAYFGGSIYLTNGSHGCVNTPYDQVAAIYDAVSIGTPVVVYQSP